MSNKTLLDEAPIAPDYVGAPPSKTPSYRKLLVVAILVISAVVVVAALALSRRSGEGTTTAAAPPAVPDAQAAGKPLTAAEGDALLKQQMAAGWVPYGAAPAMDGVTVPNPAWVRYEAHPDPKNASPEGKLAVYDAPNGNLVGYNYSNLGYVPKGVADNGQFDATQARIAKFGCDIKNDQECMRRKAEEQGIHTKPAP